MVFCLFLLPEFCLQSEILLFDHGLKMSKYGSSMWWEFFSILSHSIFLPRVIGLKILPLPPSSWKLSISQPILVWVIGNLVKHFHVLKLQVWFLGLLLSFASNSDKTYSMNIIISRIPCLRRMTLRVRPTGEVVVRAPKRVSEREIQAFVTKNTKWIEKQKNKQSLYRPLTKEEIHELRTLAKSFLPHRTMELAMQYGFTYQKIACRHQHSRWGSCSHRNTLSLNIEIIRLPRHLQDYIILHELNHTIHKHHQKLFWDHLEHILPWAKKMDREIRQWKIGFIKITDNGDVS